MAPKKKSKKKPAAAGDFDYRGLDPVFAKLSKPAQRALINHGIRTPRDLAKHSLDEVLSFHGIGPSAVPHLKAALKPARRRT